LIGTCQRVAAEGYGDVGEMQAFIDGAEQALYTIGAKIPPAGGDPWRHSARSVRALVAANERVGHVHRRRDHTGSSTR